MKYWENYSVSLDSVLLNADSSVSDCSGCGWMVRVECLSSLALSMAQLAHPILNQAWKQPIDAPPVFQAFAKTLQPVAKHSKTDYITFQLWILSSMIHLVQFSQAFSLLSLEIDPHLSNDTWLIACRASCSPVSSSEEVPAFVLTALGVQRSPQ